MPTITIFGATGKLAGPVISAFLTAGWAVRALVRDEAAARRALPPATTLIRGDLRDATTVREALNGAEYAYLNLSIRPNDREDGWLPEREGLQTVLAEARRAGIRRVGYLSSLIYRFNGTGGWRWWIFDVKAQAVEAVKASGLDYVIFHPSNFMDNFVNGPYRQGNKVLLAGTSKEPMYFIAATDYARQVVAAFERLAPGTSASYDVQGPEALTADQAAAVFLQNYGGPAKLVISRAPLGLLRVLGWVLPLMNYGYHIVYALNHYPEPFTAGPTNTALGTPTTALAEFARAVRT